MVKKVKWSVEMSNNYSARADGIIEVDDDADEEEIDELVRNEVFNIVSWGWTSDESQSNDST